MANQGFGYSLQWQVPICALIFIIPAVFALKLIMKGNAEPLKFSPLWRSCWRHINPLWLLFYRAFACLSVASIMYIMVELQGAFAYYFYTQEKRKTKVLSHLSHKDIMQVLGISNASPVSVPLTANAHNELNLVRFTSYKLTGFLHSWNALLLIVDTALNGLSLTSFGFAYFVLWSCLYISVLWITHFVVFLHGGRIISSNLTHHGHPYEMASEGFGYWVRWQVPVCALIFIIPAVVALRFIMKEKIEPLKFSLLWRSCWRDLNPFWLLIYRAFACLCLASILYNMVALHGSFAFFFYTQWTLALVMFYFALGTVISAYGCWVSSSSNTNREEESKGKTKVQSHHSQREIHAGYLMLAMYQTSAGASVLTDIVFWCVLVPLLANVQFELTLLIGFLHTLNALLLIVDTALNGLSFTWFGFAYFALWSCLYISFQWIIHLCGFFTWWPYPFLELDTPWAPLWYFGLALFHIPCYWIYALIVRAKNSLFPRLFPRAFVKLH